MMKIAYMIVGNEYKDKVKEIVLTWRTEVSPIQGRQKRV